MGGRGGSSELSLNQRINRLVQQREDLVPRSQELFKEKMKIKRNGGNTEEIQKQYDKVRAKYNKLDEQIQKLRDQQPKEPPKRHYHDYSEGVTGTTTTYERARKRRMKHFDDMYGVKR